MHDERWGSVKPIFASTLPGWTKESSRWVLLKSAHLADFMPFFCEFKGSGNVRSARCNACTGYLLGAPGEVQVEEPGGEPGRLGGGGDQTGSQGKHGLWGTFAVDADEEELHGRKRPTQRRKERRETARRVIRGMSELVHRVRGRLARVAGFSAGGALHILFGDRPSLTAILWDGGVDSCLGGGPVTAGRPRWAQSAHADARRVGMLGMAEYEQKECDMLARREHSDNQRRCGDPVPRNRTRGSLSFLAMPRLLNYVVAIYLIVIGVLGLIAVWGK